jgi:hypothetical protein
VGEGGAVGREGGSRQESDDGVGEEKERNHFFLPMATVDNYPITSCPVYIGAFCSCKRDDPRLQVYLNYGKLGCLAIK